jgi:isochorismate pyruvate lyase
MRDLAVQTIHKYYDSFNRGKKEPFFELMLTLASVATMAFGGDLFSEEKNLDYYYEIATQQCQDIPTLRKEMDRINNDILRLLTERTAYVKRAGDLKSKTTKIADDPQRVAEQEKKILEKSKELGLPVEISLPAFRVIVETSIRFQQQYIDGL